MNELNQVERIKIKLRLAKNTDTFLEVFGASTHEYQLNKPTNLKEVEAFEQKYNITLPQGYKTFLTAIGNGGIESKSVVRNSGAGPDYGIFKLNHEYHFIVDPALKYLEKEAYFNTETTTEAWESIYENMDEEITDEEYDKEMGNAYAGILLIGYSGCSGFNGVMLNGTEKGRVVYACEEIEYCPRFAAQKTFLDWYEQWLDDIISGKRIKKFTVESEEGCLNRFLSATERRWKTVALSYILTFTAISKNATAALWKAFEQEQDRKIKIYLLNVLTKFDYESAKKKLKILAKNQPLEFLKILHLYAPQKTIEWKDEIQSIIKNNSKSPEILEYIQYITTKEETT